ncbi:FAST kinase domain-containing protein 1, mitochondrial isoform X1 [Electrophorus electricus]|uniref:FAST kinase domains 1 n=1 Tax=Electrophorus electricus TaxID=8005 RepID=A0A4W4GND0_ELEEL|nr:FAST kinase domain-containing protein 1, mitochondrial isoform X1 [Electrophorus electricus]XP_026876899.2 FAST kinase domain-containing protein 1, mitochondrial isoform X1 [Electrophorus electricus]
MFRLQALRCYPCRVFNYMQYGAMCQDQVLAQIKACTAEDQVFDVVGKNKAKLSVKHVNCAVHLLWQFQKNRPQMLRTVELTRSHPQFLTLCVLAENKISLMDDTTVVEMLYGVLRLSVEPHDSLVQHLVMEAWSRQERFLMATLSKFSVCLSDQNLYHSPIMGQITEIVRQKLDTIDDARVLTTLMISVSHLVSPRLRDALIVKADTLLDSMDPFHYNNPRRIVQFLRNIRFMHQPLLEKCNHILLKNVPHLDTENISIILGLFQSMQYDNFAFTLAAKQRLMELVDTSTDALSFTKLFVALVPLAGHATRERLENAALLLAEELNAQQALAILELLEETQCRNLQLIDKIASILHKNLEVYGPVEISKMTQSLLLLHYQNPELFSKLRSILLRFLQASLHPYEVPMLSRVISMLPSLHVDEAIIARVNAMVPQCSLNAYSSITVAIARWIRNDPTYRHSTPSKYVLLLQTLKRCGQTRLQNAERLDAILEELRYISGEWFEETLLEETVVMFQRLVEQVSWANVPELAVYLTRTSYRCETLLERMANVAFENMHKIHYSGTYATLLPFAVLDYNSPKVDELFDACIQRLTPHIRSFEPHLLVLLAYALALVDCFPEEVIREVFSVDFLAKLDAQLEMMPNALNMRVRLRLMELNRAVCLECPEFQVPWFHKRFCQQLQKRSNNLVSPVQQQIQSMLGEVLGGINCARAAVLTPYFYTVDFECVQDRNQRAIPYSEPSQLQIDEDGKLRWESGSGRKESTGLPPGARRIALDFLDSKSFCKNSQHMKGEVQMKKRHLEILGYHVLHIPHFEWNSMELSTQDTWKEYLKKKLFTELT